MKKIITLLLLLLSTIVCNSQTKQTMEQEQIKMKRMPDESYVDSPVKAKLSIRIDGSDLVAILELTNISDKTVWLPDNMIGGNTIIDGVFFAKVLPMQPNLTFKPQKSCTDTISDVGFKSLSPNKSIVTQTKLNKFFDIHEKKYETLIFIFNPLIPLLDNNNKQIYQGERNLPVVYSLTSNNVFIKYEDIKDVIK